MKEGMEQPCFTNNIRSDCTNSKRELSKRRCGPGKPRKDGEDGRYRTISYRKEENE
jgi:hypothetical protein